MRRVSFGEMKLLLVCVCVALPSVSIAFDSSWSGRWIPDGVLGVVEATVGTNTLKFQNLMPGMTNPWQTASCDFVNNSCLNLCVLSNENAVLCDRGGGDVLNSTGFLSISWRRVDACPSTFQTNWLKFGGSTTCLTNSQSQPEPLHQSSRKLSPVATANITKVHVVFTQHFDLGYTDFAWCVVSHYFWYILPGTALTALELPTYVYTTHSWILYLFFNCEELAPRIKPPPGIGFSCPSLELQSLVRQAILARQIVWHAFPFDGFNEMLGSVLMDFSFRFSDWLADFFFSNTSQSGRLSAVQQVDVPGLTRSQVSYFLKHNASSLYVGQNPCPTFGGTIAELPNLFMWRALPGSMNEDEDDLLLVFTHKNGYGGLKLSDAVIDERSQTALVVQCTLENRPPYTPQDINAYLDEVAAQFPSCNRNNVIPSTYDAFAHDVKNVEWPRNDLLLFEHDIGDTWVRALASDPMKTKQFLSSRRQFEKECEELNANITQLMHDAFFLITGCEHNWGLPWQANWEAAVYSYQEKRDLLRFTGNELDHESSEDELADTVSDSTFSHFHFTCLFASEWEGEVQLGFEFDRKSGGLVNLSWSPVGSDNSTVVFLDTNHSLFELLYVVHETTGPFPSQAQDGWGDPMSQFLVLSTKANLISIEQNAECTFTLTSSVNQSFFDNNTGLSTMPTDGSSPLMNLSLGLRFSVNSFQGPPSPIQIDATLNISGHLQSTVSSLYQSWARIYSYGDSFNVLFNPKGSIGQWRVEALGTKYSPYDFGPLGTCNYHVADHMFAQLDNVNPFSTFELTQHDSQLVLFGWNNASWITNVNASSGLCLVNDAEGISSNIWNQWNANWVVGFPWTEADTIAMNFRFTVKFH